MVYGNMAYMVTTAATIKRGVDQATTGVSFVASGTAVVIVAEHALMALQYIPRLFPCAGWIFGLAAPAPASTAAPAMVRLDSKHCQDGLWSARLYSKQCPDGLLSARLASHSTHCPDGLWPKRIWWQQKASSWDYRIYAPFGAFLASAFSCFKPGG